MAGKQKQTAVVGCGWFGRAHVRNFAANSDLIAVCDSNKELAEKVAMDYDARAYSDVKEMLASESLDAVSVVTPPRYIPEIGLECAKKGVDVLLEKPCAIKLSDLDKLAPYADSIRIMPGFLELFNPDFDELKAHLDEIGEVMTIDSSRIGLFPKRNWGIGVMMDLGVHDVYLHRELARFLTGDGSVVGVSSVFKYLHPENKFEDAIFVLLKFHKLVTCISANWITPSKFRMLKIAGSDASLEVNFINGTVKKIWGEDLRGDNPKTLELVHIPLRRDEPLQREVNTFLYADNPPLTLQDAREVLKITLQALHQI